MRAIYREKGELRRRTAHRSLAGPAAVLLVVVLSLVAVRKLQVRSMLADCMLTQQPACEVTLDRLRVSRLAEGFWGR